MTSPVGCTRRAIRFFTGSLRQRPDTGLPDRHRHGLPRIGDRLVALGARCPGCLLRLTGASSRCRECTPSTARSARFESSPTGAASTPRTRLASGSPLLPSLTARLPQHLSSGPVGVRFPVRSTQCTLRFPWSRGIFGAHRVIPRNVPLVTEVSCSSTGCTQVVHRWRVDAGPFSGLNDSRDVLRAVLRHLRLDHHHLLAHVGPRRCALRAAPTGGSFVSRERCTPNE